MGGKRYNQNEKMQNNFTATVKNENGGNITTTKHNETNFNNDSVARTFYNDSSSSIKQDFNKNFLAESNKQMCAINMQHGSFATYNQVERLMSSETNVESQLDSAADYSTNREVKNECLFQENQYHEKGVKWKQEIASREEPARVIRSFAKSNQNGIRSGFVRSLWKSPL